MHTASKCKYEASFLMPQVPDAGSFIPAHSVRFTPWWSLLPWPTCRSPRHQTSPRTRSSCRACEQKCQAESFLLTKGEGAVPQMPRASRPCIAGYCGCSKQRFSGFMYVRCVYINELFNSVSQACTHKFKMMLIGF